VKLEAPQNTSHFIRRAYILSIFVISAFLFAMSFAVIGCRPHLKASSIAPEPKASELDVLVSFLGQEFNSCVSNDTPLVIADTFSSVIPLERDSQMEAIKSLLSQASDQVPSDLIRDFCDKNAKSQLVWPDLQKHLKVIFLSQREEESLFSARGDKHDGWNKFYTKYPKSPGIITVSRIGFNHNGTMAMIYLGWQGNWLDGAGQIYVLRKQNGKWVEQPVSFGPRWVS
jgi:hypothetical protein